MKTFVLNLLILFSAASFALATPNDGVSDTTEMKPFVLTIDVDRSEEVMLAYQNAEEMVQITLLQEEDGIVFVDRVSVASQAYNFPTKTLAPGKYTLLVEYAGRPVTTHVFEIER